jgi:hypothetical protein
MKTAIIQIVQNNSSLTFIATSSFSGVVNVDSVNNEIKGALLLINWHVGCNVFIRQAPLGTQNNDKFEI